MADTSRFTAIGAVDFKSFEWNLWSCDQCGAVVEWNDLDVHEEHHHYEDDVPTGFWKWLTVTWAALVAVVVISLS